MEQNKKHHQAYNTNFDMKLRKLKPNKQFMPCVVNEDEEIFRLGIFELNISRMIEDIESGKVHVEKEDIHVEEWFNKHCRSSVNEDYLPMVANSKPVIQAEIRPGMYEIIDGHHRLEKSFREGIKTVKSYKLTGEQLLSYFTDVKAYLSYVDYWNSKLSGY